MISDWCLGVNIQASKRWCACEREARDRAATVDWYGGEAKGASYTTQIRSVENQGSNTILSYLLMQNFMCCFRNVSKIGLNKTEL